MAQFVLAKQDFGGYWSVNWGWGLGVAFGIYWSGGVSGMVNTCMSNRGGRNKVTKLMWRRALVL